MKKYFSALCVGLVIAGVFNGCSDDDFDNGQSGNKPSTGAIVNFTLNGASTRTVYDEENEYQINWTDYDQVRIYCAEAEDVKNADYSVTHVGEIDGHIGDDSYANLAYNENGLAWGSEETHNFYAVYPAGGEQVTVDEDGVATCEINQNQICTFPASPTDGNYKGTPDMSNAYMVANLSTTPVGEVSLTFKPIMTTLEVTVRGTNGNDNQGTITVTGLTIFSSHWGNRPEFQYNIANGTMVTPSGNRSQSIFVGVNQQGQAEGEDSFIDLQAGESITFTVFLPPMDINSQRQITVRPNVTGSYELSVAVGGNETSGGQVEYVASSKGKLTLPEWPSEEVTGNNWITPLDDDIYVQQLSIPGTHDAAAYETTGFNLGATQGQTLEQQFDMGIRAFDMRAAKYHITIFGIDIENEMWLWHGITQTSVSLRDAMDLFKQKLQENPKEFVILQFRHESEPAIGKKPEEWNDIYGVLDEYTDIIEPWRADLTIGDCRGNIVILTRDTYTDIEKAGLVSGWPDNTSVLESGNLAYIDDTTPYYVQDYYQYNRNNIFGDPDGSRKVGLFEDLLEVTKQFKDPNSTYFQQKAWALNHTSGYATSVWPPTEWTGTTDAYQSNANRVNPTIYSYLQNQTDFGPTGIVFMDWVGERAASVYTVYGDLLPQAIIDNNYRYTMLRKSN